MNSKHTSMTLGEVHDLLQNLNKVKNFYQRQIACISASIREHEKIENRFNTNEETNHNTKYKYDRENNDMTEIKTLRKKQKKNNRFKIRVKSSNTKKKLETNDSM